MLISPQRFLTSCGASTQRALAINIYESLQKEYMPPSETPQEATAEPYKTSLFAKSFSDIRAAAEIYEKTGAHVNLVSEKLGMQEEKQHTAILPPLFIVSSEFFIHRHRDIVLVAFPQGPIVPVIESRFITHHDAKESAPPILDQIIELYEMASGDFITQATASTFFVA